MKTQNVHAEGGKGGEKNVEGVRVRVTGQTETECVTRDMQRETDTNTTERKQM